MRNTMERIKIKPMVKNFRRGKVGGSRGPNGNGAGGRKPSIKITVSADVPEIFNNSQSPRTRTPSPQTVIKRIININNGGGDEDEAFARITVDDSVVDFPSCVDFGIHDFLCYNKDEIDLELSSDTDTSFLEATPPHRFSDSELESQIEIMSITLDNALNLAPNMTKHRKMSSGLSKDDTFTFDIIRVEDTNNKNSNNNNRRPPPPRPFRRHISLPASIFMSYLQEHLQLQQQMKAKAEKRISLGGGGGNPTGNGGSSDFLKNERFSTRKLSKIDGSYSSNESTSTETEGEDGHIIDQDQDQELDQILSRSVNFDSENGMNSSDGRSSSSAGGMIVSSQGSEEDLLEDQADNEDDDQAFTSEVERKSLVLRYMRRLVRQDTSGNFAPPDYCI